MSFAFLVADEVKCYEIPFSVGLFRSFSHNISIAKIKIAEEIGSPCLHPLFNLNLLAIHPPFIVET